MTSPVTTDRSRQAALLALLDTMIADPYMFAPQVVASAAERARDMIVALDSSATASDKDAARYRWLRQSSFTSGIRVDSFEFPRGTWDSIGLEALDSAVDAAMGKANG